MFLDTINYCVLNVLMFWSTINYCFLDVLMFWSTINYCVLIVLLFWNTINYWVVIFIFDSAVIFALVKTQVSTAGIDSTIAVTESERSPLLRKVYVSQFEQNWKLCNVNIALR